MIRRRDAKEIAVAVGEVVQKCGQKPETGIGGNGRWKSCRFTYWT
jgi:hypothetical protein